MGGTALPLPKPQELPVPEDATTGVFPFTDNIENQEYLRNLRDRTAMNASGHPLEAVSPTSPESQIPKTPISINPSAPTLKAGETVNLGDVPKPSLSVEKAKAPKAPLSVEPPDMFQYPEEAADWYEQKNHPGAARTARIIAGVRKGVANTAEGLLSPTNLAFLVATEGTGEIVPVVEELINAGFTAAQVKMAIDTIPQVKTALKNHDPEAAAQAMTEGGIAGAFGVAGAVHGAKGAPEEKSPENITQTSQSVTSASGRPMQLPPERTTGVPESDEAIKQGGGIPGGKFEKAGKMTHDLHLFHDPQTGSTLALPENKVSPEAVSQHIAESRAKFAAGKNKLAEIPGAVDITPKADVKAYHPDLQKIANKYGTSENAAGIKNGASFITPDGKFIHLTAGKLHPEAIKEATGEMQPVYTNYGNKENRPAFLDKTDSVRIRFSTDKAGDTVHISVPKQGVTEEQVSTLRQAVAQAGRNGQVILERADITPETKDKLSLVQDFPRPSDTEKYLQQIQAHPSQKMQLWMEEAAKNVKGGFSINPQSGKAPTEGKILSILPEEEVNLGHPATPEDIRDYYNAHKTLFDTYPELHIGGYENELNISAIGPHAEDVAKKLDQHSIYDLGKGKEILVGGKNKDKNFPNYSLEHRLADLKGEVSKTSHATLSPIPSILKGGGTSIPDESVFGHEYGHGAQAVVNGGKLMGLYSHWHPKVMETGSAAAADIAWPSGGAKTFDEWITKDPNNAFKALQQALSGPVTQEVLYGVPVNKNLGAVGDMKEVADILQKLDLSPEQSNDVVEFLANSWKEKLTTKNPLTGKTLADIIKQHAPRNEDIREELLASPDKIQKFSQEVAQHEGELRDEYNRRNSVGVSEGTEQVGRENVARTEGRAETTNISKGIRRIPGAIEVTSESRAFPKGSAVPLLTNPLPTEQGAQKSLTPSDKLHQGVTIENPVMADFQRAMGEWMKKTAGNINEPSAELSRSIRLAHNEVNHWIMENGGEGKGWYRRKTDAAIKVLSKAHPQLKDPAHATIFKALWTAHSYGNDPNVNMTEAEQNLSNLENKGKLEYDKGVQPDGKILHWSGHTGNVYTLAKTQHLIDQDGETGAAKWLTTKHPWSEIQDKFKDAGLNVSKKSIPLDKDGKTYGAMAFGPKGGAFFLNLNGINDFTTVDIWGARALRRWEGNIGSPDTLTKNYNSNLIVDRPPDAGEIERFHKVVQSVAKKLNLDTDDVQALQWYFEHKLYEVHGVGEKARDYEEAAKNVVNKKGGEPVNALALLKALGQWKSPVQSRGNEGASGAAQKARESSASGDLFKNH